MGLVHYLPLLLLLLSASVVVGGESVSASDHEARFEAWCVEHGKAYATLRERAARHAAFVENVAFVPAHNDSANSGLGGPSYTLVLKAFADLTHDEFRATRLG
ncbi:papain-like cysteine proteinase [Hordeum vulgare]|nr:papain-like cysteine proteinase [Hordeum vulgare]